MACATPPSATTSGAQREHRGAPSPADMLRFPALGLSAEYRDLGTPQARLPHDGRGLASLGQIPLLIPFTTSLQILILFLAGHTWSPPSTHPPRASFSKASWPWAGRSPSQSLCVKPLSSLGSFLLSAPQRPCAVMKCSAHPPPSQPTVPVFTPQTLPLWWSRGLAVPG